MSVSDYVDLPFVTDPSQIADDAIAALQARWDGWIPNDADMESITIEALSPMAANLAALAAMMPPAALRQAGALFGVFPLDATPAQTTVTLTAQDNAGYTAYADQQIDIDGTAFALVSDAVIAPGATSVAGVPVIATVPGSAANGLTGLLTASISLPIQIVTITVESPTSGGADAEDDPTFLSRFSRALRLRAKTLVTPTDYELEATEQAGIGRAHASANVTTKTMTVTIADSNGLAVPAPVKAALAADYDTYRCSNWTVAVADATYTAVSVTWAATAYPGYDQTALAARINALLQSVLSPPGYGALWGGSSAGSWWNEPTIKINKLIALVGNVEGVDDVTSILINGAAADFTMSGTVALPSGAGVMSGTVS
jgi:Baseplate J-like protein